MSWSPRRRRRQKKRRISKRICVDVDEDDEVMTKMRKVGVVGGKKMRKKTKKHYGMKKLDEMA